MNFTLLGTGTSQGIPVIGCECSTCTSNDPRDGRLRCSALIQDKGKNIVIDVGPDFRYQILRQKISSLDAVLLTHEHNDHVIGLDDLRPFIFMARRPMDIYAEQRVLDEVKERFKYAFEEHYYPGAPSFNLIPIQPGISLDFGTIKVDVIRVMHGGLPILGFIINDQLAYLTDVNHIPRESMEKLSGIKTLVIDSLRKEKHHSHNSLADAIQMTIDINPKKTFLIHMSHMMGPTKSWEKSLPEGVYPSFDNQRFELSSE